MIANGQISYYENEAAFTAGKPLKPAVSVAGYKVEVANAAKNGFWEVSGRYSVSGYLSRLRN